MVPANEQMQALSRFSGTLLFLFGVSKLAWSLVTLLLSTNQFSSALDEDYQYHDTYFVVQDLSTEFACIVTGLVLLVAAKWVARICAGKQE